MQLLKTIRTKQEYNNWVGRVIATKYPHLLAKSSTAIFQTAKGGRVVVSLVNSASKTS